MRARYILVGFLIAVVLALCAANDMRDFDAKHPVATYAIDQQTWAAAASTATTDTLTFTGRCEQVEIKANETTDNITFTVAVTSADSGTLFSKAAIADDGTTVIKLTDAATDVGKFWANGTVTVTCTPSAVPGASGATLDVTFYVE